jgi:hypothetical protein
VQGLVSAVSRDGAYEKLESVGDGYAESRSSWIGDSIENSCSSCTFILNDSMRRRKIGSERLKSEISSC